MPTLTSRGAASARGFGLLGAAPLNLQTATFTSPGSWTAPAGVTSLVVLTGAGGNGEPASEFWAPNRIGYVAAAGVFSGSAGTIDGFTTYEYATNEARSVLAGFNSSTADRTIVWGPPVYYWNPTTSKYYTFFGDFQSRRVRGTMTASAGPWDNTTQTIIRSYGDEWYFNGEAFFSSPETAGGTSFAFGNTYPGGVGGAATPVTTTNVPVTPGQTYTMSPAEDSGGYITFQYYA
jgi:hypothetical protein